MNYDLPSVIERVLDCIYHIDNKLHGAMSILAPESNHIAMFLLQISRNLESLTAVIKRDIYDPENKNDSIKTDQDIT